MTIREPFDNAATSRLAFFCGEDMDPGAIRRHEGFESARFVAIGAAAAAHHVMPSGLESDDVWGIVVRVPEHVDLAAAPHISVTLRDGTAVEAAMLTTAASVGSADGILAQARYWELPVPYRNRLESLG